MKLVILTNRFPYPPIGGERLRIYHICKYLSNYFDIVLVSQVDATNPGVEMGPLRRVCKEVHTVRVKRFESIINCLKSLFSGTPTHVAYYRSSEWERTVSGLCQQGDIVLYHLLRTCWFVPNVEHFRVAELTDAISMNYGKIKILGFTNLVKKMIFAFDARKTRLMESEVADAFDRTILVAKSDASYIDPSWTSGEKIKVFRNGVSTALVSNENLLKNMVERRKNTLLYIGNMESIQNIEAVESFAKKILPLIDHKNRFKLLVVGAMTRSTEKFLLKLPRVEVVANPDTLENIIDSCWVGICPVLTGAGMQNKILDYMARGLPVIASSMAAKAFENFDEDGLPFFVADSHRVIAEILRLLEEACTYEIYAKRSLKFVTKHFSWNQIMEDYAKTIVVGYEQYRAHMLGGNSSQSVSQET